MKKFESNAQMNFMIKFLWVHLVVLHSIGKKGEGTKVGPHRKAVKADIASYSICFRLTHRLHTQNSKQFFPQFSEKRGLHTFFKGKKSFWNILQKGLLLYIAVPLLSQDMSIINSDVRPLMQKDCAPLESHIVRLECNQWKENYCNVKRAIKVWASNSGRC